MVTARHRMPDFRLVQLSGDESPRGRTHQEIVNFEDSLQRCRGVTCIPTLFFLSVLFEEFSGRILVGCYLECNSQISAFKILPRATGPRVQ
jgi:hypothetical protein